MRRALLLGFTILSVACSSATPPPETARAGGPAPEVAANRRFEDCVAIMDVQRALAARNMAFQDCYADGLSLDPQLRGTVTLSVVIPPSGSVKHVRVASSDLGSDKVDTCIAEVAGGLEFEQESCSMPQTVEYPVHLARGSSEFASAN